MHPQIVADVLAAAQSKQPHFTELLCDIGIPLAKQNDDLKREGAVMVGLAHVLQHLWTLERWDDANTILRHMMQDQPKFWSSHTNLYTPHFLLHTTVATGSPRAIGDVIDACWIDNKPDHDPHYLFDVVGEIGQALSAQLVHDQSEACLDVLWAKTPPSKLPMLIQRQTRAIREHAISPTRRPTPIPCWSLERLIDRARASGMDHCDLYRPLHLLILTQIAGGAVSRPNMIDEIANKISWSELLLINSVCTDRELDKVWRAMMVEGSISRDDLNDSTWWFAQFGITHRNGKGASFILQSLIKLVPYAHQEGYPLDALSEFKGLRALVEIARSDLKKEHGDFLAICDRVFLEQHIDQSRALPSLRKVM